jgi:hypothetical protein
MTLLTAENITSRRVLRQGLLASEGCKEMELQLIRRGVPASFTVLDSWTLGEMIMFRGLYCTVHGYITVHANLGAERGRFEVRFRFCFSPKV